MSHVLPITWHLIISLCFSTQNWFLIFPASIGNTLRNPPLYLDGRVKHHIEGRSDSSNMFFQFTLSRRAKQSMVSCMFLVQKSMQSKSNQNKIPLLPDFPGSPPLEHRRHHKNKWSKKEDKKCNGDGVWSMPFFSLAKALLYSIIRICINFTCMQHLARVQPVVLG